MKGNIRKSIIGELQSQRFTYATSKPAWDVFGLWPTNLNHLLFLNYTKIEDFMLNDFTIGLYANFLFT